MDEHTIQDNALANVFLRNEFYRKKFHFALAVFILCVCVITGLGSLLIHLIKNPPQPLYFVADSVGRLQQDVPVQNPNMSTQDVAAWTVNAVQQANSYDFMNYRAQLQGAQKYFTSFGWRNYMKSLTDSNNLLSLTQRKMVAIAQVVNAPRLIREGLLGNAYAYRFEMPMLVTYMMPPYDDKSQFQNALTLSVVVQRRPLLDSDQGLAIVQMNATLVVNPQQSQNLVNPPAAAQ